MNQATKNAAKRRAMLPPHDPGGGAYDPRQGATSERSNSFGPAEGGMTKKQKIGRGGAHRIAKHNWWDSTRKS